ncbi:MAG: PfaD family polyunsaturated fatty acid/polyketide biosynthesis protein [Proteobacteria bacterium]|nr:PfaD family polyunsaturated fatty acid/polyketide biosynthesis protein [Desulfobacula sp.]MBU4133020.1 PfaD family polyunsaturated fatty acid/polyketide biosynthesis protein [Pseudomonadota bacterium]
MDTATELKKILWQVSKPAYIIDTNGQLSFSTKEEALLSLPERNFSPLRNVAFLPAVGLENLGDHSFKQRHGLTYPYVAGAMANGISSAQMVKTMAGNGMVGFFGAGGLSLEKIEENIIELKRCLGEKPFGFNLIHSLGDPDHEMATVTLYLKHQIRLISAAAFMRMTLPLVYYRVKGIYRDHNKGVIAPNRIIAKVSRIEIARQFFAPPPEKLVAQLLASGLITREEADLSREIPMAQDLTAEADSGGHTDNRPALTLLPTMISLKNEFMETYHYKAPLCVGMAGGISTPESAAAAFGMGAAYILTGSINQSCVEAGICQEVKRLLCQAEQADVAMAPAADMFEIGARVQVLKRGTLFPVRAEKLYQLYKTHDRFEEIDEKSRQEIEEKILKTGFDQAWQSTLAFFESLGNTKEVQRGQTDAKYKMALVFRSYLGQSSRWAINGVADRKMDYQIWCGPSIGAFNQWVKGSFLEGHENRKTAEVALNLLFGACLCTRTSFLRAQGIELPLELTAFKPLPKQALLALISGDA